MMLLALLMLAAPAWAQVHQFTDTTSRAINNTTPCGTPMIINFSVTGSYNVGDINIGIFATHTWRGDIRATLQSPAGTRVQIVNGDTNNISGDNFNVLLDDGAAQVVNTDAATGNHSTTAPTPYANTFSPNASLSAFNGQAAAGTWRLEICDLYPAADNGSFTRADLYITEAGPVSDLSLTKTVSNAAPAYGAAISYTLQVTNAGPNAATGVVVRDLLPVGVNFVSASGFGSYDAVTGNWTVGSIPVGTTRTLTINVTVNASAGATVTNAAEIFASGLTDPDSTPNNSSTAEDDDASVNFTVSGTRVAGTPPTLVCPVGTTIFDWDSASVVWPAGTTNNNFTVTGIGTYNFNIVTGATWLSNATYGGQSPAEQTAVTGGLPPGQSSLFLYPDFASIPQNAVLTLTLPTPVPGLQFMIFDVDYNAGQFADRVAISGTFNGATVYPTVTNGVSNYVIGNSAYGDGLSADTSANGNITVTFTSPVDTIIIDYGNHSLAPANPGGQAIALHDITFCRPTATLTMTKTSTLVSDPVNGVTNPFEIPGATIRYCILAHNPDSGTAANLAISDTLPANATFVPGSLRTGNSCAGAATVEDDNNSGGDESDPDGAAFSAGVVTASRTSLISGASLAVTFDVTVN